uniref:Elongin-A n=1 Tax=Rhabditophanes sp. KR3021 TaxID=114890 RepID=A0AC35U4J2_9BILA
MSAFTNSKASKMSHVRSTAEDVTITRAKTSNKIYAAPARETTLAKVKKDKELGVNDIHDISHMSSYDLKVLIKAFPEDLIRIEKENKGQYDKLDYFWQEICKKRFSFNIHTEGEKYRKTYGRSLKKEIKDADMIAERILERKMLKDKNVKEVKIVRMISNKIRNENKPVVNTRTQNTSCSKPSLFQNLRKATAHRFHR